jgi:hypothetical protein
MERNENGRDGLLLASNKNSISGRVVLLEANQRPVIQVMTFWLLARLQGASRPEGEPPARGRGTAQEVREVTKRGNYNLCSANSAVLKT